MSLHKHTFPKQAQLTEALKAHGLEYDTPSQLADAFRLGWQAFAASDVSPAVFHESTGTLCSVCKMPQYQTPSGANCANGHGGAEPL